MYDPLTSRYAFACPVRGETHVLLSRFRRLEELPGAQHPAVYRVEFACGCGHDHPGLLTHVELDWAGHLPSLERPDAVLAMLLDVLRDDPDVHRP